MCLSITITRQHPVSTRNTTAMNRLTHRIMFTTVRQVTIAVPRTRIPSTTITRRTTTTIYIPMTSMKTGIRLTMKPTMKMVMIIFMKTITETVMEMTIPQIIIRTIGMAVHKNI